MCNRAGTEAGFLIWLPLLQLVPLHKAARIFGFLIVGYFLPFVDAGVFVHWAIKMCEAAGKNKWLALPLFNVPTVAYLAFSKADRTDGGVRQPPRVGLTSAECLRSLPAVLLRSSKTLLGLSLAVLLGAHWLLLQSVAWVGMIITYSQTSTLSEAISMTFDGEHPCRMCIAVKEGKKAESKQLQLKPELKLDFLRMEAASFLPPLLPFTLLTPGSSFAPPRNDAPPGPPPRLA